MDWKYYKLKNIAKIQGGFPYKSKDFLYTKSGYPVLKIANVRHRHVIFDGVAYISKELAQKTNNYRLYDNDVLISMTGSWPHSPASVVGRVARFRSYKEPVYFNQRVGRILPNPEYMDKLFLFYILSNERVQTDLVSIASGSANQANISGEQIGSLTIPIPPLSEQKAIASILGSLDDKIELNNKMSQTLETMARALYKSWFVDFEPVVAKAAGKRPFGMDDETAALFPDKFVDSELGPIPEGWETSTIGEQCKVVGGGTPSTKNEEYWSDGNIWWATPKDLSGLKDPIILSTNRKITQKGLSKISSGLLPSGTVLLSSRAPVGYIAIAEIPLAINQGFIAILETDLLSKYFIYFWLYENIDEILQRAGGTTFAEISKRSFRPIPMIIPSAASIEAFTQNCLEYFTLIESNINESKALSQIRDLLLPKLISGEIRIKDAEKVVEEVL